MWEVGYEKGSFKRGLQPLSEWCCDHIILLVLLLYRCVVRVFTVYKGNEICFILWTKYLFGFKSMFM